MYIGHHIDIGICSKRRVKMNAFLNYPDSINYKIPKQKSRTLKNMPVCLFVFFENVSDGIKIVVPNSNISKAYVIIVSVTRICASIAVPSDPSRVGPNILARFCIVILLNSAFSAILMSETTRQVQTCVNEVPMFVYTNNLHQGDR